MQKIYYVANARMPNEKAHGIQIAKMCEAFVAQGADVTLIVPGRQTHTQSLQEFYGLTHTVPVVTIPVFDLYRAGKMGFVLSSLMFVFLSAFYLWVQKIKHKKFVIYTVDMDTFSYALLPLAGPTWTEMHTPKTPSWLQHFFFSRVKGVVATNRLIRERFVGDYKLSEEKVISEPNGVDFARFAASVPKQEARQKLNLPQDIKIILYVGRFYLWKGLDILPSACAKLHSGISCYVVGGSKEEFVRVSGASSLPDNMVFAGGRPVNEIPLWLQAADALLVLGTAKNEDSSRYTSPMKLFEYMASNQTIVASATPAVSDVLTSQEAFLFEPDNADSLAHTVELALTSPDAPIRAKHAQVKVHLLTWDMRAERILAFINRADTLR